MRRVLTIASLICLTAFALLYPVIEGLDRWDGPGPFSDSEIQIIAVLTLVGVMFVLARLLVTCVLACLEHVILYLSRSPRRSFEANFLRVGPLGNVSPPLILRI